jgi:hypothetical protein
MSLTWDVDQLADQHDGADLYRGGSHQTIE